MEFLFYVSIYIILLLLSCTPTTFSEFHILNISNEHSSFCNRSFTSTLKNTTQYTVLELLHRGGACARGDSQVHTTTLPSIVEILSRDQLRIKSLHAHGSTNTNNLFNLSVKSGQHYHVGDYIVRLGFGTPKKYMHLTMDTGSQISWIQCQPCLGHCYKQRDKIFNPRKSTSYSNMSCKDSQCRQLSNDYGFACHHNSTCMYRVLYADHSHTIGFLGKDTLTLTQTDVFQDFIFGCGQNNSGPFGKVAGVLGLSRHPVSFISQIFPERIRRFSYCLPPDTHSTGYLTLGKNKDTGVSFTPLISCPDALYESLYCVEMISITIGRIQLPIKQSVLKAVGTLIDSGTVITHLPPTAYEAMSEEFNQQMNKSTYPVVPGGYDIFDTCYKVGKHKNIITLPVVAFTFKGGVTVNIDPSGTLILVDSGVACLAFVGNSDPKDVIVFGNLAQMKHEVVYDVYGGKLGFGPSSSCG